MRAQNNCDNVKNINRCLNFKFEPNECACIGVQKVHKLGALMRACARILIRDI